MPKFSEAFSDPVQFVSDLGSSTDDFVNDSVPGGWATVALIAAGYYYAPEINAYVAANGAATIPAAEVAALNATGAIATPVTGGTVTGVSLGTLSNPIVAAATGGLTIAQTLQLAKLGVNIAGLVGGANKISNMSNNSGGGGGMLTKQDRSGFSSGSANYSPEYYQQVQNKYNQYMPQAKGADITTDLKNWYETKYTPNATNGVMASSAGVPTTTTTGTGYTTPTSMTNLGIKPQAMLPVTPKLLPSVAALTSSSTPADIAKAYADGAGANGGNTEANRATAVNYLRGLGIPDSVIQSGYGSYLATLPATTGTTMAANSSADQIAQAYGTYAAANGGDNQANQAAAITYLRQLGVPDSVIQAAYPIYKSSMTSAVGGGMLTGGASTQQTTPMAQAPVAQQAQAPSQPLYTSLTASSSPEQIAAAYREAISSAGGDTAANQQVAAQYLRDLGLNDTTISQGYGLFKG